MEKWTDASEVYHNRLTTALRAAKICIYEVDLTQQRYIFFENAEDIFGISGEQILEDVQKFSTLSPEAYQAACAAYFSHPDDAEVIDDAFAHILNGQATSYIARMRAGQARFVWCKLDVIPILEDGRLVRMIGVITDISEIYQQKITLEQRLNLDGFTGLWNKQYSIATIRSILKQEAHRDHALLIMDVDHFKEINDTYGHAEGDRVLLTTTAHLVEAFRKDDVVGRFGGDEFIVFLRNIQGKRGLEQLRERVQGLTRMTSGRHTTTNSIGIACYPSDGASFEELFERADQALYEAKKRRGMAVFYREMG